MAKLEERELAVSLFEVYGGLLTEKEQETFRDYHYFDLSLSEIAENRGISRSAVSDSLSGSLTKLKDYEEKLGMLGLKEKAKKALEKGDISSLRDALEDMANGI